MTKKISELTEDTSPANTAQVELNVGGLSRRSTLSNLLIELIASSAQGDVLYNNGTTWVRLAAGTAGQFLKTLGAAANPAWATLPVQKIAGTVANPGSYYTSVRAQVPLFRADAALTITRIHIHGADLTPTSEMALDLKFADDLNTGGFANAAVIDVCDTTSGVVTITSGFDDATVPSGKYIYWQFDSAPHADWKDFYFEVYFTYD